MLIRPRSLKSVSEAAEQFGVSPSTVRNWIDKGYIQAFRFPSGVRRIPEEEVTRFLSDYFSFAPATEGEEESRITANPPDDELWGPPFTFSEEEDSSGQ